MTANIELVVSDLRVSDTHILRTEIIRLYVR